MRRVRMLFAVAVLALAALPAPGSSQALAKLRIATIPLENGATAFYAKELGLFT